MRFLSRFQRIERVRRSPADGPAHPAEERFQTLESIAAIPETHTAASARFAPAEEPEVTLQPHDQQQPFVRCMGCGRDHGRGTEQCLCGAALDTAEVRAFNDTLWASLRAQQATEEAQRASALTADTEEAARLRQARQALGEQLAREVAERARGPHTFPVWIVAFAIPLVGLAMWSGHAGLLIPLGLLALAAALAWGRFRRGGR